MTEYKVFNTKALKSKLRELGFDYSDLDMTRVFHDGVEVKVGGDMVVLPAGDGVPGELKKHKTLLEKYGLDGEVVENKKSPEGKYRGKHRSHTKTKRNGWFNKSR
jgi:hypothetical protein